MFGLEENSCSGLEFFVDSNFKTAKLATLKLDAHFRHLAQIGQRVQEMKTPREHSLSAPRLRQTAQDPSLFGRPKSPCWCNAFSFRHRNNQKMQSVKMPISTCNMQR